MARFLRIIKQGRWFKQRAWDQVSEDDCTGDPLVGVKSVALLDLQEREPRYPEADPNSLSVFKVETEADINRVIVALASKRQGVSNFDYAVFDDEALLSFDISFVQNEGWTPDSQVNQWHYDVTNLTVLKLVELARAVARGKSDRMLPKNLTAHLKETFQGENLNLDEVNQELRNKLT